MPATTSSQTGHYVHDLDPVIFELFGNIAPRWYGLAYVLGFFLGILVLRWLARRDRFVLSPDQVSDFLTYAFIFGVFLGGRVGYFLFYKPATLLSDPLEFFNLLGGGMASHGGILGLIAFTFYYARRHKVSWPALGDGLVVVAPIGLAFGRIANFINGELYGRVTNSTSWAVIFPESLRETGALGDRAAEAWNAMVTADPRIDLSAPDRVSQVVTYVRDNPELKLALATYLAPRHPSQLYQAACEGILLFAVLFAVRWFCKNLAPGILTGLFFILYAVARISVEQFREPDADLILGLTRGQFYSTFMIVIGLAFLAYGFVSNRKQSPANA